MNRDDILIADKVCSEIQHVAGDVNLNLNLDELLPKGLTPHQICEEFFKTCLVKDPQRFLACLHVSQRVAATSLRPGPYDTSGWEMGRARLEKYMATYALKGQVGEERFQDSEPLVVLEFQPLYGPVPGYAEGSHLGPPISLTVQKQGGSIRGEWRIIRGAF